MTESTSPIRKPVKKGGKSTNNNNAEPVKQENVTSGSSGSQGSSPAQDGSGSVTLFGRVWKLVDWASQTSLGKSAVSTAQKITGVASSFVISSVTIVKSYSPKFVISRAEQAASLATKIYSAPIQTIKETVPFTKTYFDYGSQVVTNTSAAIQNRVVSAKTYASTVAQSTYSLASQPKETIKTYVPSPLSGPAVWALSTAESVVSRVYPLGKAKSD